LHDGTLGDGRSRPLGVRPLAAHRTYLENLGGEKAAPLEFLRRETSAAGALLGVELAATLEIVT